MKKTILITGASTGIGKLTALHFAKQGWNVAATMRTLDKGVELAQVPNIKLFRLDVLDEASIQAAISGAVSAFGGIDVLHNNAGYGLVGAFEAMSPLQIKQQFDTNVFGVMNVTRALLPHFRGRKSGVIITSSSMGGLVTFPLWSVYHASKWAIEGFMESLHYELRQFNIRVKNIEPGSIRTEFENAIEFVSSPVYDAYALTVYENMLASYRSAPSAEIVANAVWRAANDGSSRLRYVVGAQARVIILLKRLLPDSLFFGIARRAVENGSHPQK